MKEPTTSVKLKEIDKSEEVYVKQKIRMKRNNEIKFFFPNFHFRLLFSETMSELGVWCGAEHF